jgi:carbonic anhydrase
MINYAPGSTFTVGKKTYTLKQFHFHHPSEELINGKGFDMVAHLVHTDSDGHFAVVAILFKAGAVNPLLEALWKSADYRDPRTIDVQIGRLRRKLRDLGSPPRLIRAVRGVGYAFTPRVEVVDPKSA